MSYTPEVIGKVSTDKDNPSVTGRLSGELIRDVDA